MADFTEEYLRRLTDVENQKVAQLSGIKDVLEGSGTGGGGTGSSCLAVMLTAQVSFTTGQPVINQVISNRTAREILEALQNSAGVTVYLCHKIQGTETVTGWGSPRYWSFGENVNGIFFGVKVDEASADITLKAETLDDYFIYNAQNQPE